MHRFVLLSALAGMAVTSGPAMAASDYREATPIAARPTAFIGAQARLSFGSSKPAVPVARLTAGMTNLGVDQKGSFAGRTFANSFELGFTSSGRANFYLGGQPLSAVRQTLGMAPTGAALLAVGGLALVGVGVMGASGGGSEQRKPPHEVVCLGIGVCPPLGG